MPDSTAIALHLKSAGEVSTPLVQEPDLMEVLSALRGRGADRRWGFGASCGLKVRERAGFPHHRASSRLD